MEGTLLANRYRLEALIGEGGLAEVYRATDLVLDRAVAVKLLRDKYAHDPEAVDRFRSEARAAAKLNHPNIVQIFDTGAEGELYYIVMEFLPEPNLKRIFDQYAPLPSRKVLEVISQCCKALSAAHRAGLVHRDVKPQNILFTDQGLAKLSDFGIAAAVGAQSLAANGMVLGSAHYISPEQAQGKPVGPQSDIYSLGCVMYEALTGHTLFTGDRASQIAAMHVEQRPLAAHVMNPNVTPSEEFILNKAMSKDPARRYQTADEMLADLDKLGAGEDLDRTGVMRPARPSPDATMPMYAAPTPAPPSAPSRPVPAHRRAVSTHPQPTNPWMIVAAILIGLIILGLAGWMVKIVLLPGAQGKTVQVPGLDGLTEANARQKLTAAGLTIGSVSVEKSDTAPEGTVTKQDPPAGTMVDGGTKVNYTIALGKEIVSVVNVVGVPLDEAGRRLSDAGFTLGQVLSKFSREPEGTVVDQSIRTGTRVEKGTAIDVSVSKGPEQPAANTAANTFEPTANQLPAYPDVHVEPDASYHGSDASVTRWTIRVTPQGQQPAQKVDIWFTDQRGRVNAWTGNLDPGTTKTINILGHGSTTVEVRRDGEVVFEDTFEPPASDQTTP